MRSASALALTLSLAVTACAAPRAPDTALPAAFETTTPTTAAGGAPAGTIALDTWWTAFGDPELTELVQQALARNTDVRLARARVQEARAQRNSAIFQYLPRGDLSVTGRRTDTDLIGGTAANIPGFNTSGVSENYAANFNVSWEVDPFGRGFLAYSAANSEVDRVRFDYEAVRAQVAAQTADAFFQIRGLAIQLADAEETARIRQSLYDVASRRAGIGVAPGSDADRVAGDLAQAKSQVEALQAQLQGQKRALLILAGRVVEPTANINAPPRVGEAPPAPTALPSELLQRRPDVRSAEAALRSQAKQQKLAVLDFFPTFVLQPTLGWQRIEQPNYSSETRGWSIGGTLTQPILSIPRLLADLKAQNARSEQVVTQYEKTVQTAFQEAETALVSLESDRRRVALLAEGEARARRAFEASRLGYERGLVDLNTTLNNEQAWRTVRAQLTAAQVQALRRAVQAYKAVGGGWPAQAYAKAG